MPLLLWSKRPLVFLPKCRLFFLAQLLVNFGSSTGLVTVRFGRQGSVSIHSLLVQILFVKFLVSPLFASQPVCYASLVLYSRNERDLSTPVWISLTGVIWDMAVRLSFIVAIFVNNILVFVIPLHTTGQFCSLRVH